MKKFISSTFGKAAVFAARTKAAITCSRGENFLDSGFKILIIVVIAALFLAALYALFGDVIMPKVTESVTDLFDSYSAP